MRVPQWLAPLLLIVAVAFATSAVVVAVNGVHGSENFAPYQSYSGEQITYTSVQVYWADPGDEVRTVGPSSIFAFKIDEGGSVVPTTGNTHAHIQAIEHLGHLRFAVVPAGTVSELVNGSAEVLYEAEGLQAQTFTVPGGGYVPPVDPSSDPESYTFDWASLGGIQLVWYVQASDPNYDAASQALFDYQIEGRTPENHRIVAVDGDALRQEAALRTLAWTASGLSFIALVLSLNRPSKSIAEGQGFMGSASLALLESGQSFLESLRRANVLIVVLSIVLGTVFALALPLYSGTLTSGEMVGQPREQPFDGWQYQIFLLGWSIAFNGLLIALAPAISSHQALNRWKRLKETPPIEGELGD